VKPTLELLSGVPTVVYGFFALLFVTPLLQTFIPGLPRFNVLSAGS
jgi:phosphate transport system permease protein